MGGEALTCGAGGRPLGEAATSVHEVRVSCPDATGLGCDITRMLLDFDCCILDGNDCLFSHLIFALVCDRFGFGQHCFVVHRFYTFNLLRWV